MDELAFLTLILLINHQIRHVLVEFYECMFLAKMKGNHILWSKEQKQHPITHRHADITWIRGPTRASNGHNRGSGMWQCNKNLPSNFPDKGGGQWLGPLVGQLVSESTDLPLWWEASWRFPYGGSRCHTHGFTAKMMVNTLYKYEKGAPNRGRQEDIAIPHL